MPRNPNCELCDLSYRANSVCVWGDVRGDRSDPKDYDVLVLGEAPGWQEDRDGSPFVGASGEFLSTRMAKAGIDRYYVCNVVRCFPGRKRKPNRGQIKACASYLEEELSTVKPKYILALGNIAVQALLGRGQITKIAGKEIWSDKLNAWIMPSTHPAYILRNMGKESSWMMDLHRFARLMNGDIHDKPPVKVKVVCTIEELHIAARIVREMADRNEPFTYDVEATYGLDWWHKDYKIYTIAFGIGQDRAIVVPVEHPKSPFGQAEWEWFFGRIEDAMCSDSPKIAHNMMYDDLAIYRYMNRIPKCTWDTMIAWHVIDENSPKGLKWLARALLGWPDYGIDTKDLANMPLEKVAFYNGCDAAATHKLWEAEQQKFKDMPEQLRYFLHVPMKYAPELVRMSANGVHIDEATLVERTKLAERQKAEAKAKIPVNNPGSTKQIADWLYSKDGGPRLPVLKLTDGGNPSTDEDTIKRLVAYHDFPEAKLVLDYRRPAKNLNTYFEPTRRGISISVDRRMRYDYRTTGTETGRLSGSFHVIPRDPFVKNIHSAPKGWTLASFDFSQIEARLAAWAAIGRPGSWDRVGPSTMLAAFYDGRDVYKETAAEALGKNVRDITPDERQIIGKVPTLASLYEISAKGLMEYAWTEWEIVWSIDEATMVWAAFRRRWPEFPRWHEREGAIIRASGYVKSAIGRMRRLPEAKESIDKYAVEAAVRSGINMPIQSLAADITEAALILISPRMDPAWGKVVGHRHDELLFELRDDKLDRLVLAIGQTMENAWRYLELVGLHLPDGLIKVEYKTGPWGGPWKQI